MKALPRPHHAPSNLRLRVTSPPAPDTVAPLGNAW